MKTNLIILALITFIVSSCSSTTSKKDKNHEHNMKQCLYKSEADHKQDDSPGERKNYDYKMNTLI